jgi:hypothetical protein
VAQEVKYRKKIICLADSRKTSGHCIAGREVVGSKAGDWVRPVSKREHQEISFDDLRYEDGHPADLLDVITIPMLRAKPRTFQSENHLIADEYYWRKNGRATWAQIEAAVQDVKGPLWANGSASFGMTNNRVPDARAETLKNSLLLVRPQNLKIIVGPQGGSFAPNKRRVSAEFQLDGLPYKLALTDLKKESAYLQGENGTFPIAKGLLCISLGESYNGHAYKLAAALITSDRLDD